MGTQTEKAIAKKSLTEATKPLAPEAGAKQSDRACPAEPHELNSQRQRLKKAAAMGAEALKSCAPTAVSPPPLTPLAALWPTPAPAPGAVKSAQAPARQVQTVPLKVAVPQASPVAAVPPRVKVTFVVVDLGAKQVSLSGEFNGWSPNATPMRRDSRGHWETTVELAPGHYQYKFVVDGEWIPDPLAHANVWNQHGTLNSVVEVQA
jgi:hypothetical protein